MSKSPHILLTVLGLSPRESTYQWNEREFASILAPVALLELLPPGTRPTQVLALCTPEAEEKTFPQLERLLPKGVDARALSIPSGEKQEDVDQFLKVVSEAIPTKTTLTVDVTHGFRHFSFLTYIAVLYLEALKQIEIKGAYYGMFGQNNQPSTFLDLRPLLELPSWLYALRALRETGSTNALAHQLEGSSAQIVGRLQERFRLISVAFASGLPLELGQQVHKLLSNDEKKPFRKLLTHDHRLPRADEIVSQLEEILKGFSLNHSGQGWKGKVNLDEVELKRQAHITTEILAKGNYPVALRLMSEWTQSWCLLRQNKLQGWLDYDAKRRHAASVLRFVSMLSQDKKHSHRLDEQQKRLGEFWKKLSDLRNAFAHNGMRKDDLLDRTNTVKVDDIKRYWTDTLSHCPSIDLEIAASDAGTLLISPIGNRPGVLYSAVLTAIDEGKTPSRCLVICSRESKGSVQIALDKAGFQGETILLTLSDPFGGSDKEQKELIEKAKIHIYDAREVLVNVTGGTTFMGLIAQMLAKEANSTAKFVKQFGLVDRRSSQEQEYDPYCKGSVPLWV